MAAYLLHMLYTQWRSQDVESGGGSALEKVISDARVQSVQKIFKPRPHFESLTMIARF